MGRQSTFTQEVADEICDRLAEGESLRAICKDEGMPSVGTVCRWLGESDTLQKQYARARELQADTLFDEVLHIADNQQIGEKRKVTNDGKEEVSTGDMIEHRRLQIDARKWMAGKLRPKKYGEFKAVELTGANGGPVVIQATSTDEQL